MAQHHASRGRLAALNRPRVSSGAGSPDGALVDGDDPPGVDGNDPAGVDAPDPAFWGSEPRVVRRSQRRDPDLGHELVGPGAAPPWWSAFRDRVRDLRVEVGVGIVVVAIVALVAGVLWYRVGIAGSGTGPSRAPAPESARSVPSGAVRGTTPTVGSASEPAGRRTRGDVLVVHVAGAVARPGVIAMPAGARVIDAVEGAGGALPDADLDRINLAAELVDGQRILVARVGAGVDPAAAASGTSTVDGAGTPIDLNAATAAQLESLPGIGPALASAILAERDRRGGFRSINELREVRGIGEARFADLRDLVTV